jgi:Trk K+ transport system NAD-binding subunit
VPRELPNTASVFIFLRKMRGPLIAVIATVTLGSLGLVLVPGPPDQPPLTAFQAFYFMTFTATTIGLGEIPYAFSTAQRAWVVFTIYVTVITWAFALSRLMAMASDSAFLSARRAATFSRTVGRLREPFTLVLGYGYIGRSVVKALDVRGRRVVVVDQDTYPIERVSTDLLTTDVPAYTADARDPAILGVAGLDQPHCEAVLALTGEDEANLQIVMACRLLRPDLPVLARVGTRRVAQSMREFNPTAVINAFDDYGRFLLLALHQPHTYRLIMWLMADTGTELPPLPPTFSLKRWLVVADGVFGAEITQDLVAAGHEVSRMSQAEASSASLEDVDALVCGSQSDATNLALAAHARRTRPEVYLAVRVMSHQRLPLLEAFRPDSVFFPPGLVTQQILVHLVNPHYWKFLAAVMSADDTWSREVTEGLAARVTTKSPEVRPLRVNQHETPAVVRWLEHRTLSLGDLFRSPNDRDAHIAATTLLLVRGKKRFVLPDEETELRPGDEIVIAGRPAAFGSQTEVIYDDSTLHRVVTGREVPTSWFGRAVSRRGRLREEAAHAAAGLPLKGGPEPRAWPALPSATQLVVADKASSGSSADEAETREWPEPELPRHGEVSEGAGGAVKRKAGKK